MARPQYKKMEDLQAVPLFARLSERQLRRVAKETDEVTVTAGHVLAKEQHTGGQQLLIVVDGELTVKRGTKKLAKLGPGDVVGEMSLIDGRPYSASVVAATDATVLVIGGPSFRRLLDDLPGLKDSILRVLVDRLRMADARLVD